MSIEFTTLASGSEGNCTYVGTENTKVLIDVGISCSKVEQFLKQINVDPSSLTAIFITHEHTDHIKGVSVLSRKYNIPIFATEGTFEALIEKFSNIKNSNKNFVYADEPIILNDLYLMPFDIPHDAKQPVAYFIKYNNFKLSILTDLGHISPNVIQNIKYSNAIILESNYDETMLKNGPYPAVLKNRILGDYGHISNEVSAKFLAAVFNQNLKNVFLAHISKNNNTPDLAFLTFKNILSEFRIKVNSDFLLHISKDFGPSKLIKIT